MIARDQAPDDRDPREETRPSEPAAAQSAAQRRLAALVEAAQAEEAEEEAASPLVFPTGFPRLDAALDGGLKPGWVATFYGDSDKVLEALRAQLAVGGADVYTLAATDEPLEHAQLEELIEEVRASGYDVLLIDECAFGAVDEETLWELFAAAKRAEVAVVLQRQAVRPGVQPRLDELKGSARQVDFCDLVLSLYQPEHEPGIDEAERLCRRGQVKAALLKNRFGPAGAETTQHLYYDPHDGSIKRPEPVVFPLAEMGDSPSAYWPLGEAG